MPSQQHSADNGYNPNPSCYLPDRIALSYHRQPGSRAERESPPSGQAFHLESFNASGEFDLALLATGAHPMEVDLDPPFLRSDSSSVHYGAHGRISGPTGPMLSQDILRGPSFPTLYSPSFGPNLSSSGAAYGSPLPPMTDMRHTMLTPSPGEQDSSSEEHSSSSPSAAPLPVSMLPSHPSTEEYLRRRLEIPPHLPVNLHALSDVTPKKQPPITHMIKLAIWGSQHKRLTLRQIYEEIERRYPSLKELKDKPWQRSIRHNLSLKAIFVRVERPASEPGKGHYWAIDIRQGEGNKRDRKRKDVTSRPSRSRSRSDDDDLSEETEEGPVPYGGRHVDRNKASRTRDASLAPTMYRVEASGASSRMPSTQSQMPYSVGTPPGFMSSQPLPSVPLDASTLASSRPQTFSNIPRTYSVPPNIEHRPIHRNNFDSFMSMEQLALGSYGMQTSMQPTSYQGATYLGSEPMPYGHPTNNPGMGGHRPASDEDMEQPTRARKHRTQ